jgi:hypothetical protein
METADRIRLKREEKCGGNVECQGVESGKTLGHEIRRRFELIFFYFDLLLEKFVKLKANYIILGSDLADYKFKIPLQVSVTQNYLLPVID